MSFLKFLQKFECTDEIGPGNSMSLSSVSNNDVRTVIEHLGGKTFNDGLYRVFQAEEIQAVTEVIKKAFPEFDNRLVPFGFDWLGRVFAVDKKRVVDGHSQVIMIDFGSGEEMQIQCSAIEFHESELIDFADDALSQPFFYQWKTSQAGTVPYSKCVGYRIPLFLGGSDTIKNLEVSDRSVYWHISGQLRVQAKSMRDGQKLGRVEFE